MLLARFLFSFILLFVILPLLAARLPKEDSSFFDRLFIAIVHSSVFYVVVIHLLNAIHLYETLSILFLTAAAILAATRLRNGPGSLPPLTKLLSKIYDIADRPDNWKNMLRGAASSVRERTARSWRSFLDDLKSHWFAWLALAAAAGYAVYVRFKHSVEHLYFGSSDPYVHLRLSKYLAENNIYGDGIYPYGFPAIISAMHKFFNLDPYIIVRFIGPTGGVLMVLSVYYALRKIIGKQYPLLFAGLFAYVAYAGLPSYVWRQISALSMEYAAVFLLPGIAFLIVYFRHRQWTHLILAGECLALTVFIHPYTAVTLGAAYVLICVFYWKTIWNKQVLFRFAAVMAISGVVGALPLIVAFLTLPVGEFEYVSESIQGADPSELSNWRNVFEQANPAVLSAVALSLALAAVRLVLSAFKRAAAPLRTEAADIAPFAVMGVFAAFYVVLESGALGLPVFIPSDRFGVYFALVAAVALGALLHTATAAIGSGKLRTALQYVLATAVAAGVFFSGQIVTPPAGDRYQYDDNVKMYLQIKRDFPSLDWTIVSPMEENPLVIGYGWHTQLWEFVRTLAQPEGKTLTFTTHNVFLFVEKIPLGSDTPITEAEAEAPFPELIGSDSTKFYYRTIENRRILEAKAYKWAENHMKHRSGITVYYDSPVLRVYLIRQEDIERPVDLLL